MEILTLAFNYDGVMLTSTATTSRKATESRLLPPIAIKNTVAADDEALSQNVLILINELTYLTGQVSSVLQNHFYDLVQRPLYVDVDVDEYRDKELRKIVGEDSETPF